MGKNIVPETLQGDSFLRLNRYDLKIIYKMVSKFVGFIKSNTNDLFKMCDDINVCSYAIIRFDLCY